MIFYDITVPSDPSLSRTWFFIEIKIHVKYILYLDKKRKRHDKRFLSKNFYNKKAPTRRQRLTLMKNQTLTYL
jgi:hypothetical protein